LQIGETRILIRFLGCIFHGTGNSARLCQNFGIISGGGGGGLYPPNPPSGYAPGEKGICSSEGGENCTDKSHQN
jgi:hypothetical protein